MRRLATAAALFLVSAAPALAHPGSAGNSSFMSGLAHPLSGLDHVLAMVAVGLWVALLARSADRRALWLVPAAFVGTMCVGFAAALLAMPLPFVEPVILASVVVIGLFAAVALNVPTGMAMALVGFFAFFHGHAHGSELGVAAALPYAAGFALATAALHVCGIALGMGPAKLLGGAGGRLATRLAGGATAMGGLWLAFAG